MTAHWPQCVGLFAVRQTVLLVSRVCVCVSRAINSYSETLTDAHSLLLIVLNAISTTANILQRHNTARYQA